MVTKRILPAILVWFYLAIGAARAERTVTVNGIGVGDLEVLSDELPWKDPSYVDNNIIDARLIEEWSGLSVEFKAFEVRYSDGSVLAVPINEIFFPNLAQAPHNSWTILIKDTVSKKVFPIVWFGKIEEEAKDEEKMGSLLIRLAKRGRFIIHKDYTPNLSAAYDRAIRSRAFRFSGDMGEIWSIGLLARGGVQMYSAGQSLQIASAARTTVGGAVGKYFAEQTANKIQQEAIRAAGKVLTTKPIQITAGVIRAVLGKDIIIDTNVATALEKEIGALAEQLDAREKLAITLLKGKDVLLTEPSLNEILQRHSKLASTVRLAISEISKSDREQIIKILENAAVGGKKGTVDREIVLHALSAKSTQGTVPTLATADDGMINGLARIASKDSANPILKAMDPAKLGKYKNITEYIKGKLNSETFEITILGRTLKVMPIQPIRNPLP